MLSVVKQSGMGEWGWPAGESLSFLSFFAANAPLCGHMRRRPERDGREKAQKAHKRGTITAVKGVLPLPMRRTGSWKRKETHHEAWCQKTNLFSVFVFCLARFVVSMEVGISYSRNN